ncbi:unnamed protein product [[Candida] boidinii]|nr:unnamed protein product [[Candida] boidinii]
MDEYDEEDEDDGSGDIELDKADDSNASHDENDEDDEDDEDDEGDEDDEDEDVDDDDNDDDDEAVDDEDEIMDREGMRMLSAPETRSALIYLDTVLDRENSHRNSTNATFTSRTSNQHQHHHHHLNHHNHRPNKPKVTVLRCGSCHNDICLKSLIRSDNFYGNSGPAYFVKKVINIKLGKLETKTMRTGNYDVKSTYCIQCNSNLGWTYIRAEDPKETYKEKQFVIERNLLEEFKC